MGGYFLLVVFVNLSPARKWLGDIAERALSDKLQTEVRVGEVELGLFNRITLRGVRIEDRAGRTLLDAGLLSAKVAVAPLAKGVVSLRSVSILDASVSMFRDKRQGPVNFQFVIDAFKVKQKEPSTPLDLRVNSLILRRCKVCYDEPYEPVMQGALDLSHLSIQDVNANLSLKRFTSDSLVLRVRDLRFRERSGLDVRSLTFRMSASRNRCSISRFELILPRSYLANEQLTAVYDASDFKRFWHTLQVSGAVRDAVVATTDIACLLPVLRSLDYTLFISSSFSLEPSGISVHDFSLDERYGRVGLSGKAGFRKRSGRIERGSAVVTDMHFLADDVLKLYGRLGKKELPAFLKNFGEVRTKGRFSYVNGGMCRVDAEIDSDAGGLNTSVRWKGSSYELQCMSEDFSVAGLLDDVRMPDRLAFRLTTQADINDRNIPHIKSDLIVDNVDFRGYTYRGLQMKASWDKSDLSVAFSSSDENLSLEGQASAVFDGKNISAPHLSANIRNVAPARLHLYDGWGDTKISASVAADSKTANLSNLDGTLEVRNFVMRGGSVEDGYGCETLRLGLSPSRRGTRFKLASDFAQADIDGELSLGAVRNYCSAFLTRIFPEMNRERATRPVSADSKEWRFFVQVKKDDFFRKVLDMPFSLSGPLTVEGFLSGDDGSSSIVASSAGMAYGAFSVRDMRFYLNGRDDVCSCLAQGLKRVGDSDMRFALDAAVRDGVLHSNLNWRDDGQRYHGQLNTVTRFGEENGSPKVSVEVVPTEIVMGDTVWNVVSGVFDWENKAIRVKDFCLSHADQSLALSGSLSPNPADSLVADLHDVDVAYVLNMIDLKPVSFSGPASGKICARRNSTGELGISADLSIPDFHFNGGLMGHADIRGRWSMRDKRLWLDADMREEGIGSTQVNGFVGIAEKGLDLQVTSRNTNLHFLRRYISDIFGDIEGRTTGKCRIYGPFKALDFEGEERPDLSAEVLATGVNYRINGGTVRMSAGQFDFSDFRIADKEGGSGMLKGRLGHAHLKNVTYDVSVDGNRMMVYDQPPSPNASFYATVYGTGTIGLRGRPGLLTADVNMRPDARTLFTYVVDSPDTFGDTQLLRFEERKERPSQLFRNGSDSLPDNAFRDGGQPVRETDADRNESQAPASDIVLNLLINMTPGATLKVITNEKVGDHILIGGHGAIRATYYNKGSFPMFGTLGVERGVYKMSIQDVIRKDFLLQPGGRIVFSGNPFDADLNLSAVYSVPSASLADLNIGTNLSDNSVRVNCLLNFGGKVHSPQVTFGLDLPTVSDDIKQMVRQLIATDEDMNMQILYLLGVGRFYTYNYGDTQSALGGQSQSSLAMKSFLSNTLSNQLNSIISNAMGTSNWSFGTNLATGQVGWSDMEVAGLLSGRLLNSRLILNGNFGYRDRATSTTNFVGDFDISYLLTPSGSVSLKAYSETNDRYFSKSSLTTQGIGIKLKRDFTNLRDLFTVRKKRGRKSTTPPDLK